jgi:hypothetical protein
MNFEVTINTVQSCPADFWTSHSYSDSWKNSASDRSHGLHKQNGMVAKEMNLLSVTLALSADRDELWSITYGLDASTVIEQMM